MLTVGRKSIGPLTITPLTHAEADGIVTVKAGYEMPGVQATLEIEYAVDNTGAVTIAQSLHATPGAQVPDMFRFGMRFERSEEHTSELQSQR